MNKFQHKLGVTAKDKITKVRGIITARSENLYGCNRYYIQPEIGTDNKVPDGWWIDEDAVHVLIMEERIDQEPKDTGGPMSSRC